MDHGSMACFQAQEEQGRKLFVQIIQNGGRSLEIFQGCRRRFLQGSCRTPILHVVDDLQPTVSTGTNHYHYCGHGRVFVSMEH
jgi:hypothetical protein